MTKVYLGLAVIGTVVPWIYFVRWFGEDAGFVEALTDSSLVAGFTADLIIASVSFLAWSFLDARRRRLRAWWWC